MLVLASITESLANFATDVVGKTRPRRRLRADDARERVHPDPVGGDDAVRGLQRRQRRVLAVAATLVGASANLVGSWIAYGVGYFGRIELVERHGSKLHISPKHLATADRWFESYGEATVFFTRMLPIIRTFISLPAGVARMPFWRFSIFTFARLPAVGASGSRSIGKQARRQLGRTGRTGCTTSTTPSRR